MTAATLTIADFLLARIAEDEIEAEALDAEMAREFGSTSAVLHSPLALAGSGYMDYPVLTVDSTRVLAECEAKRRIVERCTEVMGKTDPRGYLDEDGWVSLMWETMYDLAAVYADHPDYCEEWRP